jgi:putative membrane protein
MAADATSLAETRTAYASHRTDLATERTREALVRTRLAYERTMMAWVRTATSLISFGFTIYKFFQYLRESAGANAAAEDRLLDPRAVALVMIGLGVGVLLLATIEHRRGMNELRTLYGQYGAFPRSLAAGVAILLGLLGLLGLILVFLRQ